MKTEQRTLKFLSLDQVMPEVDRLLSGQHTLAGTWSLGQICNHLTDAITFSVENYPETAPWIVRRTIGPILVRRILKKGGFPSGQICHVWRRSNPRRYSGSCERVRRMPAT